MIKRLTGQELFIVILAIVALVFMYTALITSDRGEQQVSYESEQLEEELVAGTVLPVSSAKDMKKGNRLFVYSNEEIEPESDGNEWEQQ
ncbi:hypothetical protein M3212_11250 [Alkalihalobacillus oceani]|uniref:hypothetical protein n=1 Tax=Halalkalibacter oceani TaxID=1653776 RepID=UPI00203B70BF|nr:hypothetical protein [Halalkalibacter oceani]MCM3761359.1 hypothetical protein [Halalkalibacter oceani]